PRPRSRSGPSGPSPRAICLPLRRSDPWVEERVQDIHQCTEYDDEKGTVESYAHDRREIEIADGLSGVPANPFEVENGLGQDRAAAQNRGEVKGEEADDRDERVAQDVPHEDGS